jgi:rhamnosyltransferase
MTTHHSIAAAVVLYNPDKGVLANLESIKNRVATIFVVDNSDNGESAVLLELMSQKNVTVLQNSGNIGIASALNLAARSATEQGYEFLLTLDQDSRPLPGMVDALVACYDSSVGLVAPFLLMRPGQEPTDGSRCRPVLTAMTSGSLLRLDAYLQSGPFRDDFFIDFVDIEYCLRLHKQGFKVIQADRACLEHAVGTRIGPGTWFSVTTHSPLRKYYKTRNRLQVWREYGSTFSGYIWRDRIRLVLELFRLLLFEPEKKAKSDMMWRGWLDYRQGRFGKYVGKD